MSSADVGSPGDTGSEPPQPSGAAENLESRVRSWITARPLWLVGIVAILAGGVVAEIFALAARGIDVPMEAPPFGSSEAEEIFYGGFIFAAVFQGVIGLLIALGLARWASRPARTWLIVAGVGLLVSFIPPFTAEDTETATKVVLAISHVIVAAVVIPVIYTRLEAHERQQAPAVT